MTLLPTHFKDRVVCVLRALNIRVVMIVLLCFAFFPGKAVLAAGLKDVSGHWAAVEIEKALSIGYVKGYPGEVFKPNAGVSRAEFVAMLDSAYQVPAGHYDAPKDVGSRDWFAQDVQSALADGFVNGYPGGTFRPQDEVSRQEAACMLDKLSKLSGAGDLNFSDAKEIASWARTSVSDLVSAGIMAGYPGGTFRPREVITRAEAVVMINKALASQSSAPATGQLQVTGNDVNVRSGPSTSAQIIGQANYGDILQAEAKNDNDWYQVKYQGLSGWIAGWYVQAYQPSPVSESTASSPQANSSPGTDSTAPVSSSSGSDRGNPGTLDVQVGQDSTGTTIDIQGMPDSTCQYAEETDPQRLDVTVTGITVVRTPLEIDVGEGGLDKIVTSVSDTVYETATVEISWDAPVPLVYDVKPGGPGELLITEAPQIYKIEAATVSDFVAVNLWATAPLAYQTSQVSDPTPGLAFDFGGFILSSSLQSWQQQLNDLGLTSVLIKQYNSLLQAYVVRLTVEGTLDLDASFDSSDGGCQMVIRLQKPVDNSTTNPSQGSTVSGNGAFFYGMDLGTYPGDDAMQTWWNDSPFYYAGFYLGPAPDHPDASYMGKRQVLVDQGWGLLPVYVGRQAANRYLSVQSGAIDADDAAGLMARAGFPGNTAVFLDIETSHPLNASYLSYARAWVNEIQNQGYTAGIYCNTCNASQLSNALSGNVKFWVAHYTCYNLPSSSTNPADSGTSFATTWQFTGDSYLTYGGVSLDIDLDTSTYTDPSTGSVNVKK